MVSTTAWQSCPAVKPGPTPMTTGASVILVPRFRLARMASTTAVGFNSPMQRPSGSASTGRIPSFKSCRAASVSGANRAVTPSTVTCPSRMASQKATLRRMARGLGRSVITTCRPLRSSRRAMPLARSPAPRITTSIGILLSKDFRLPPGRKLPPQSGRHCPSRLPILFC